MFSFVVHFNVLLVLITKMELKNSQYGGEKYYFRYCFFSKTTFYYKQQYNIIILRFTRILVCNACIVVWALSEHRTMIHILYVIKFDYILIFTIIEVGLP